MLFVKIVFVIMVLICLGLLVFSIHNLICYNQIVKSFQQWIMEIDRLANASFQREARLLEDRLYHKILEDLEQDSSLEDSCDANNNLNNNEENA